jgi:hypothetical protein
MMGLAKLWKTLVITDNKSYDMGKFKKEKNMIEQFIEKLLSEKSLPADLDPEVRQQMVKNLSERAVNLVNKRLVENLPEDKVAELEKLIDSQPENAEAYQKFIDENLPNKDQVVAIALAEFRSLYLGTPEQ